LRRSFRSGSKTVFFVLFALVTVFPQPASAGPPFVTDDPEPTETGHWEIYGPLIEAEGRGREVDEAVAVEINFGAAKGLQLTVGLPLARTHDSDGWHSGVGDIEMSAKYRFFYDESAGLQIAAFPGLTVPTAAHGMGAGRVTALLPVWVQKDMGAWSIFGGAGLALNPGGGNRNFWTGGIAVSRRMNDRDLIGLEVDRTGASETDGHGSTSFGFGIVHQLNAPFRLLASGGPVLEDKTGRTGYHVFMALGLDY